jgi:hypothetical protein
MVKGKGKFEPIPKHCAIKTACKGSGSNALSNIKLELYRSERSASGCGRVRTEESVGEISGSHGGEYEDGCLLGCCAL